MVKKAGSPPLLEFLISLGRQTSGQWQCRVVGITKKGSTGCHWNTRGEHLTWSWNSGRVFPGKVTSGLGMQIANKEYIIKA